MLEYTMGIGFVKTGHMALGIVFDFEFESAKVFEVLAVAEYVDLDGKMRKLRKF